MRKEFYKQMPISPAVGIGDTGTDVFTISPDLTSGNINRIKSVYIDLPANVILNVNLSTLGAGQNDINSQGNEAGSIVFRSGVEFSSPITVTVTGTAGTAYGVKIVTEVETPEIGQVAQAGVPAWLALGLAAGFIYMASKKSEPIKI